MLQFVDPHSQEEVIGMLPLLTEEQRGIVSAAMAMPYPSWNWLAEETGEYGLEMTLLHVMIRYALSHLLNPAIGHIMWEGPQQVTKLNCTGPFTKLTEVTVTEPGMHITFSPNAWYTDVHHVLGAITGFAQGYLDSEYKAFMTKLVNLDTPCYVSGRNVIVTLDAEVTSDYIEHKLQRLQDECRPHHVYILVDKDKGVDSDNLYIYKLLVEKFGFEDIFCGDHFDTGKDRMGFMKTFEVTTLPTPKDPLKPTRSAPNWIRALAAHAGVLTVCLRDENNAVHGGIIGSFDDGAVTKYVYQQDFIIDSEVRGVGYGIIMAKIAAQSVKKLGYRSYWGTYSAAPFYDKAGAKLCAVFPGITMRTDGTSCDIAHYSD